MYVKVSGMFCTDPKWNQTSLESVVKPVLEIFGIDRYVSGGGVVCESRCTLVIYSNISFWGTLLCPHSVYLSIIIPLSIEFVNVEREIVGVTVLHFTEHFLKL